MASFKGQKNIDREKAFWSKVDIKTHDECWNYKGYLNPQKYGYFSYKGTSSRAHRFAYELHNKCKIPTGKLILHSCDNPSCCNPRHLSIGTQADNMRDMAIKGRINAKGCATGPAKLYDEDVKKIKELYKIRKFTQTKLAKMFKVSQAIVSQYITGVSKYTKGSRHDQET